MNLASLWTSEIVLFSISINSVTYEDVISIHKKYCVINKEKMEFDTLIIKGILFCTYCI